MRSECRRALLAAIAALLLGFLPPGAVLAARSPHARGERLQQAATVEVDVVGDPIVGRPIEVEVRAANPTGLANQGSITISLPGNPTIEIVGASAQGARVYRPGEPMYNFNEGRAVPISVPAVELFVNPWPAGTRHTLRLRLTGSTPYSIQSRATFRRTDGQFVNLPVTGQADQQGAPTRLIDIAPRQPAAPTAPPKPTSPPPPTNITVPPTNTAVPPTSAPAPTEKPAQPPPAQKPPPEQPPTSTAAPQQPAAQAADPTPPPAPTVAPTRAPEPESGPSMPLLLAGFGIMALGLGVALVALLLVLRRRTEPPGQPANPFVAPGFPPPAQQYGGTHQMPGQGLGPSGGRGGQGYPADFGIPPSAQPAASPPWGGSTPQPAPGWPGGQTVPSQTPAPSPVPPWQQPASPPPLGPRGTPPWATPQPQSAAGPPSGPIELGTSIPPGHGGSISGVTPSAERYVDRQLVGRGGMGSVYKAYDSRLHRWVALKIMHADLRSQPGFLERFIREAQVAAMLDHPNIVTMYDIEPVGDSIHMVMAWIEGEDLQRIIERDGALPLDRTARLLDQVASALDHAHRATPPVLHRDIKPSNIMVGPGDRAILTDFGIARLVGDAGLTQAGQMVGTPAYMAPEVIRGEEADGRADVYALGVVLFQMLTGRTPFKAETPLALLHLHVHTPPPLPRAVAPQLPTGLDAVLMRALAKDREQRFQTAGALARAYRAAAGLA